MNSIHDLSRLINTGKANIGHCMNKIKALSIKQPWAWAILHAGKDIENRTWATTMRGGILIHASKGLDLEGFEFIEKEIGKSVPATKYLPTGGIVGYVEIADCVEWAEDSPWFQGPFGFVLQNPIPLIFKQMKGQLGFFDVNIG